MKVQLNRKESSYSKLPELYIAASEIVSDETFEQMQAHPLWDHDVIQKHIQDMRSVAGGEYCLLIAPENGTDGLLVRSEGSSCARYSAYIPGGRLMTLVTPELERALRKCETAAKEAVRRECMQTLTGKWTCSLAELDAAFGAGLQENKILAELFCDKLARQAEVASAYLEGDMRNTRPVSCTGRDTFCRGMTPAQKCFLNGLQSRKIILRNTRSESCTRMRRRRSSTKRKPRTGLNGLRSMGTDLPNTGLRNVF